MVSPKVGRDYIKRPIYRKLDYYYEWRRRVIQLMGKTGEMLIFDKAQYIASKK